MNFDLSDKKHVRNVILILFIIAFLLRFFVVLFFINTKDDLYEFMAIAKNMYHGFGYSWNNLGAMPLQPTTLFPPLYVLFILLFIYISPTSYLLLYVTQCIIAASGVIPAYLLGEKVGNRRLGMIFVVLYTFFPEMIFLPARPVPEFFLVVVTLWIFYIYVTLKQNPMSKRLTFLRSFVLGIVCGLLLLTTGSGTVIVGSIILGLVFSLIKRNQDSTPSLLVTKYKYGFLYQIAPIILGVAIVLSPWSIRNYIVQKQIVFVRSGYGFNLWLGNKPGATGTTRTFDGKYVRYEMTTEYNTYMSKLLPTDEAGRDRVYYSEAMRIIRADPKRYLSLCINRLQYFLWFDPTHELANNFFYRFGYLFVLVIGIPGIIIVIRNNRFDISFLFVFVGYILLYVPVIVVPRYRINIVLFLLLFGSFTIETIFLSLANRKQSLVTS